MTDPLDPLDPELKRLFDAESRFPEASTESKTRVLERVEAAVATAPAVTSRPRGSSAVLATGAFVAGTLVGALAYRALGPPTVTTPPVSPSQTSSATATAAPQATAPAERVEPAVSPTTSPSSSSAPAPSLRGGTAERPSRAQEDDPRSRLAEEQALVDAARAALARQRPEDALEAVERHSRVFPRGELTEEREGLRVMALVRLGRNDEASRLASAFERRYPRSPLLPVLRSVLETSP